VRNFMKSPLLVAALAFGALLAPAAADAKFPALRAAVTITGQSSGAETIKTNVPPQNTDCPSQVTQQHETGQASWKVTFKPVIVPLRRTGFVLKRAPRGRGGLTTGSFSYDGTYLADDPANQDACPALTSFSAGAKLSRKPPPFPSWDGRSYSPDDIFYFGYPGGDVSDIHSTPATLDVPQDEWSGDPAQLVPIHVAGALPIYDISTHPGRQIQAFKASLLLNWNALQHKLRPLAHGRRTVRLTVSSSLDNSRKPVPFDQQCPDIAPPSSPTDYGIVSCAESMSLRYTITIRRLGPAQGCDIATAKHCLI
jgi:hypothetical protein